MSNDVAILDSDFRRTLLDIKSHIELVNNTKYINQYHIWLEKLSDTRPTEKRQRNIYLEELWKQIRAGVLEPPFTSPPPFGLLLPFDVFVKSMRINLNFSESEISDSSVTCSSYLVHQEELRSYQEYMESPKHDKHFITVLSSRRETEESPLVRDFYRESPEGRVPTPAMESRRFIMEPPNPYEDCVNKKAGSSPVTSSKSTKRTSDTSWCDITDLSNGTMIFAESFTSDRSHGDHLENDDFTDSLMLRKKNAAVEEIYRSKMQKMGNLIEKLQIENQMLHQNLETVKRDLDLKNNKAENSIHNLTSEVEVLRNRLQELMDIKATLNTASLISVTADKKLQSTRKENMELQSTIAALQKKIQNIKASKSKSQTASKKRLVDLHKEEMDILKQIHREQLQRTQCSFRKELDEKTESFERQMKEMRESYERKIDEMQQSYEQLVKQKDEKIQNLEVIIREQFAKIEKQIGTIQSYFNGEYDTQKKQSDKAVTKLLLKQYAKENKQLLAKLKREMDIQKKTADLQLSAQRAALVTKYTVEKQSEIDEAVGNLETRYKFMMNKLHEQLVLMKSFDNKIISELRNQLIKSKVKAVGGV